MDVHIRIRGYATDPLEVRRVQGFVDGVLDRAHDHLDRMEVLELTSSSHVLKNGHPPLPRRAHACSTTEFMLSGVELEPRSRRGVERQACGNRCARCAEHR